EVVYDLFNRSSRGHVVRQRFVGAIDGVLIGEREQQTQWSFIHAGFDRTGDVRAASFVALEAEQIYPGINARYYERDGSLKYDLLVAPNADPSEVRIAFDGVARPSIAADGSLLLRTSVGELREQAPYCYQEIEGVRRNVQARFLLDGRFVRFGIGEYDRSKPLVIDPTIAFSSF